MQEKSPESGSKRQEREKRGDLETRSRRSNSQHLGVLKERTERAQGGNDPRSDRGPRTHLIESMA